MSAALTEPTFKTISQGIMDMVQAGYDVGAGQVRVGRRLWMEMTKPEDYPEGYPEAQKMKPVTGTEVGFEYMSIPFTMALDVTLEPMESRILFSQVAKQCEGRSSRKGREGRKG